ncbi:MAG: bifunctional demethylmenaquinone methyltransferase/2-methoxy-6-polyprenyl-1,4-benzoquinol methylase UbiE [Trueperaceae bacterium]|nr:bifunctional demethylmenaquinone methyltransferase/2-methoxy-6-polyprenyl-1,4-benzoquinol methylase UbiE [Trueperaceae bacterium]
MSDLPPATQHPEKGRSVRAMFDAIAPRYDLLNGVLSLGVDRGWRRAAVRAALAKRPRRILDVATGTADLALAMAASDASAEVIGVDFAEEMLAVGRAKANRRRLAVRLDTGDGMALPYPDAAFDALTIAFGLRNFADIDAGLAEFRRVIRPGGRLVVLEFPPPPRGPLGSAFKLYFTRMLPWIGRMVSGHDGAYRYLPASVMAFPEPQRLAERILAAGFDDVVWTPLTAGVAALHVADVGPPSEATP